MSMTLRTRAYPLLCLLGLASCGGGGGGGGNPPPPAGDTTPPDTTLTSTPPASTNQTHATFGVLTEAGATIEISLNFGPYAIAANLFRYEDLREGIYIIRVRARDAAGNVDATPATYEWTVDLTAPDTTITSTPSAISTSADATFTLAATEAGSTYEASVDGGAYSAVTSPLSLTALVDGPHTISVRAIDAVTNADLSPATFQWTVDRSAPDTTLTSTVGAKSNAADVTFTLAASEAGSTFQASLDGGAYIVTASPLILTALAEGAHTISVRAIDAVANADPTPATFSWQIDTTPPTARVVFPSSASYTDATLLHVRGTAQDASGVADVRVNGVAATSSDGFTHWSAVLPVSIGDNSFVVSVTDDFNNTNPTAASVAATNRGVVVSSITSLAFDENGGRLLVTDPEHRALLSSRVFDRYVSVISDASRGTGPLFQQPTGVVLLDGARALVTDSSLDSLIEVNLATGNRVQRSAPAGQADLRVSSPLAYQASTQRAFVGTISGTIVAIDLANGGVRTVLSGGGVGTGTAFNNIRGIGLDSSTGTTRLLVADGNAHAIVAVDLATGDRSIVSYAAPLDPDNQVGTGPAVYGLGQLAVDEAGHRVLVPDVSANAFVGRLFSIDLVTGNRTVLTSSTSDVELHFPNSIAYDSAAGKVYFGMSERGRVFRYDLASTEVTPFVDSNVGSGYVLNYPYGVLFDSFSGIPALYSLTRYPAATSYRIDVSNGVRFALSNHIGPTGLPVNGDSGNLVTDTRAGAGKALFLDTPFNDPVMNLHRLDLVTGALSVVASAPFPDWQFVSRMAPDFDNNRVIVGLTKPAGGSGSIVAMDLTTGALTTLASLSVGNGPPMFEIGAVAAVPATFGTTARVLVGADYNLLAVNGQGDRNFISAAANIGSGPHMIRIEDMVVDFSGNRALVASGQSQALQWVDLTTGNRTMASGLNPTDLTARGSGPPLFGRPVRLAADLGANVAYVTSMETIILAVDLESGDRVIISR